MTQKANPRVTRSRGNVFRDLGFPPDRAEHFLRNVGELEAEASLSRAAGLLERDLLREGDLDREAAPPFDVFVYERFLLRDDLSADVRRDLAG